MPTVKGSYEAVIIYSVAGGDESVAALKEKFETMIAQSAEAGEIDEWGKRHLAYPINDETEGHYVLYNFESAPEFPAELERVCKITEGVLRQMIVRKDKN